MEDSHLPGLHAMSFQQQVAAIFSSAAAGKIDFQLDGFCVNPARLKQVGAAIACGRIELIQSKKGGGLSAAYSPHSDRLTVPSKTNPAAHKYQVAIVHEGVHALVDIFGKGAGLTVLDDEAAAYLAEVVFHKAIHRPLPSGDSEKKIYEAADKVATKHGLYGKKPVKLKSSDVKELREAIHAHPEYSSVLTTTKTTGHGLKRKMCVAKGRT
ncbi:MAG: hypothetical protein DHS20C21_03980 [Gemmatimonadota bacterium]|nr:MAG: hypothetical protein DHS20C21_03980 [Gemmatimonadota bacterium]